jgi:hypothetical protein
MQDEEDHRPAGITGQQRDAQERPALQVERAPGFRGEIGLHPLHAPARDILKHQREVPVPGDLPVRRAVDRRKGRP